MALAHLFKGGAFKIDLGAFFGFGFPFVKGADFMTVVGLCLLAPVAFAMFFTFSSGSPFSKGVCCRILFGPEQKMLQKKMHETQ